MTNLKVSLENIIPLTEARDHFSKIVAEVQKDKLYVLTKGGKPAVAIIDVKYLEAISGGQINTNHVRDEIKKDPIKVGLPKMVTHSQPLDKPFNKPFDKSPTPPAPKPWEKAATPIGNTPPEPKPFTPPASSPTPNSPSPTPPPASSFSTAPAAPSWGTTNSSAADDKSNDSSIEIVSPTAQFDAFSNTKTPQPPTPPAVPTPPAGPTPPAPSQQNTLQTPPVPTAPIAPNPAVQTPSSNANAFSGSTPSSSAYSDAPFVKPKITSAHDDNAEPADMEI